MQSSDYQPWYRRVVRWNYARRVEVWELNNRVVREAGGPHCLWVGMNSGNLLQQCQSFRDYTALCERSELVFLDSQTREVASGFQGNGECQQIRQFVKNGGGLVATSESSLFDEEGSRRADFALADLFGAPATGESAGSTAPISLNTDVHTQHSYLRIHPSVRGRSCEPLMGTEPQSTGERHPTLAKFAETD